MKMETVDYIIASMLLVTMVSAVVAVLVVTFYALFTLSRC